MHRNKGEITGFVYLLQLEAEELGEHPLIENPDYKTRPMPDYVTPTPGDLWPVELLYKD